jgi:hypothetical protein
MIARFGTAKTSRKFEGDDIERAVVSDDIAPLPLCHDQRVRHYDVVVEDDVNG